MVVRASLEHVSAILQRFDGGGVVDLALAEFFEPDFGFLSEVVVPEGAGVGGAWWFGTGSRKRD